MNFAESLIYLENHLLNKENKTMDRETKIVRITGKRIISLTGILILSALILGQIQCQKPTGPANNPPVIFSLTPSKRKVNFSETITIKANVKDADGDSISFLWLTNRGEFKFTSLDSALWTAPDSSGSSLIFLQVSDPLNGRDADSTVIIVQNRIPVITSVAASDTNVLVGNKISLRVEASDPDGDDISYKWEADGGEFIGSTSEETAEWRAPMTVSNVTITVTVTDENNDSAVKSITLNVFQELGSLWISDTFNDQLVKLSSDGTELLRISGFSRPQGLAFDRADRTLWVADRGMNRIMKFSDNGQLEFEITGFDRPTDIAIQTNGNAWVSTMGDTVQVIEISHDGTILRSLSGFSEPQSIDVNRLNGDIWIADTGNDRIVLLNPQVPNGYNMDSTAVVAVRFDIVFENYSNPEELEIDQASGFCWIADTGNHRVVKINKSDLSEFVISGFLNPRGLAVNKIDGSCWITNSGDNEVVKLFADIANLPNRQPSSYNIDEDAGFHFVIPGYTQPWAIDININDKIVWFAENFRIVKILDKGNEYSLLKEIFNFNAPKALVINPGSIFKAKPPRD